MDGMTRFENDERTTARAAGRRALGLALMITAAILAAEIVGGIVANSLALLADAGHMASDVFALGVALVAAWAAARPATAQRTFGYQRAEVVAAAANGGALLLAACYVFWQAGLRFADPPEVESVPMLSVAAVGLAANVGAIWLLRPVQSGSINVRAAFYHVLGDTLGSVGAIVAGAVMLATGWYLADPLASVLIGLVLVYGAGRLLRESLAVLLEAVPQHLDPQAIEGALTSTPGVTAVHDLHIWTVTSGMVSLSCHCELDGGRDTDAVLAELCDMLHDDFDIHHVTIQPEVKLLHGGGRRHELPRCTSVIGHDHRPAEAGVSAQTR
jgi:cobalt-zinc-cadmium efflux system protein